MYFSKFFCPILKEQPKEASTISHQLMLRAGLIRQSVAGIYALLPLGKIVLNNISRIIKQEINTTGALEILMPTLQPEDIWHTSGRYDDYGPEMLKITDRNNRNLVYSPTNEEQITQIFSDNVQSYKNLPLMLYQEQWKFRDEVRPRFGLLRAREFLMNDTYSFDLSEAESKLSYYKMFCAYLKIFKKLGLTAIPVEADSGPIGGTFSHEFIVLSKTGESNVYYDKNILSHYENLHHYDCNTEDHVKELFTNFTSYYAKSDDLFDPKAPIYQQNKANIVESKGIEVGHVFYFGTKYSQLFKANIVNKAGENNPVHMGSYGVGVSRLIAATIEASHDSKGIVWPPQIAPFNVIINSLNSDPTIVSLADSIYQSLLQYNKKNQQQISVIYNDQNESPGCKLSTADLLGMPLQINIGNKFAKENKVELKIRKTSDVKIIDKNNIVQACLDSLAELV